MIVSLLVDADDSPDFPGNTATALGRPIAAYPMIAARGCPQIRRHYVITESQPVKSVAAQNNAIFIALPEGDQTFETRLLHAAKLIQEDLKADKEKLELLCVFAANAPRVDGDIVTKGVETLMEKTSYDSAISVSAFNRHNPLLARREGADGEMETIVRGYADVPGDVWFPDGGVQILRPAMLAKGTAPSQPLMWWTGAKVFGLKQWGGGPVDFQWQLPGAELWLKRHGFADISATYEPQPKPQLAPKADRR